MIGIKKHVTTLKNKDKGMSLSAHEIDAIIDHVLDQN